MVIKFSTADRGTTINLTANLTGVSWSKRNSTTEFAAVLQLPPESPLERREPPKRKKPHDKHAPRSRRGEGAPA
jgi:hypothetical protein|tara:strand:+ start:933 stop:1154 length:222 start_codon:yes stop_codon:yes gene_type:complete